MVSMVDRMCMVCMDYMMRTVLIAISGIVICAAICVTVFIYQGDIYQIIHQVSYAILTELCVNIQSKQNQGGISQM